jgi:hypothetical protein
VSDESPPRNFESLPLAGPEVTERTLGPNDGEDYFSVLLYLDSAPSVLLVDPARSLPGRGLLCAYHSDGRYLWDNLEYEQIRQGAVRFRRPLVERALLAFGVCAPLDEPTRLAAGLSAFDILRSTEPAES